MANWHGYILIEVPPGFTATNRRAAYDVLASIGRQSDPSPAKINHRRESLNGSQIIIEAEFDESEITRDAIVDLVASATGLPRPPIDATMNYQIFAEGEEWMDSGDACRAFLAANRDDWDEETP